MRWEQLFDDLAAQFDAMADTDAMAEIADLQRSAVGSISTVQRLRGSIGAPVHLALRGGLTHRGTIVDVGPDWLLLSTADRSELVIAMGALAAVHGLRPQTGEQLDEVDRRFDLRLVLRRIARDRAPVLIETAGSGEAGGPGNTQVIGTIDRVGADYVELAEHPMWEPRRPAAVRSTALVPIAAIALIRAVPQG